MKIEAQTVDEYFDRIPEEKKPALLQLRKTILDNLPEGFEEQLTYGMPSYVVPHELYPAGYHCDPKQPLPFLSIAAQKNFIGFYHMGIYTDQNLLNWFQEEYKKVVPTKLDMGKSCIRLKKPDQIPFELLGRLVKKMKPKDWIARYEESIKR